MENTPVVLLVPRAIGSICAIRVVSHHFVRKRRLRAQGLAERAAVADSSAEAGSTRCRRGDGRQLRGGGCCGDSTHTHGEDREQHAHGSQHYSVARPLPRHSYDTSGADRYSIIYPCMHVHRRHACTGQCTTRSVGRSRPTRRRRRRPRAVEIRIYSLSGWPIRARWEMLSRREFRGYRALILY